MTWVIQSGVFLPHYAQQSVARVSATIGALAGIAVLLSGCSDAAESDYLRCEQLYKEKKYEEALLACQEAQKKDSRSIAGTKAIKLENKLHDKITEQQETAAARLLENASVEALYAANSKVTFVQVSTPPNDPQGYSERCMARSRAYENSYNCEPKDPSQAPAGDDFPFKDECLLVAKDRGCMPFYEKSPTRLFCCVK